MRKTFFALALGVLLTMPCVLHAEEIEIQLEAVIGLNILPGDVPMDDSHQSPNIPPTPTDFRASINGNNLSINKRNEAIPSAQATVVNAQTGSIVVNQQFTSSITEQIATPGVYVLHIQTEGGALVGQFVVQ